jgi:ubiquinone/menaquinone biosynthesis C-methylase UbiE
VVTLRNREKHVCPWWVAYTFDNPIRRLFHNTEKMFGSYVREGMTVADIGCGMGYFSIALAKMVGDKGCVYSIDLQQKMLDRVMSRARKKGVDHIIRAHKCDTDSLNFHHKANFALTFWMVHEVPEPAQLLQEIYGLLEPGGVYFLAEPGMHVSQSTIDKISGLAVDCGFRKIAEPEIALCKSFVYEKLP